MSAFAPLSGPPEEEEEEEEPEEVEGVEGPGSFNPRDHFVVNPEVPLCFNILC